MKLRPFTRILLLAAAPGWAATAAEPPPVEDFFPLPPEEAATAVLPPGSVAAATELSASSRCHPTKRRAAIVALRWRPAAGEDGASPGPQRVELTKFRDGFRTGRLEATRRLAAEVGAVAVDSPEAGIAYYWRVLTLAPQGWAPSAVERFEVPTCPWDGPEPR